MEVSFNVSIFCDLQGHYDDLSMTYNLIFAILFLLTGVVITLCSGYVLLMGLLTTKKLQQKQNAFVLSLVTSDFLFGTVFVPVFVIEFWSRVLDHHVDFCEIRSWRVLLFTYLFSCRLLSIVFVSLHTYIRTCKRTRIEEIFSYLVRYFIVIVVWFLPAAVLMSISFAEPKSYKVLGTVTYVYYFVSITIIIVSYALTIHSISVAKQRQEFGIYDEAIDFLKGVLIWFLITTLLLGSCGLVLVVLAHSTEDSSSVIEHHVYLAAIFVCTLDAIANSVVYLRKFKSNAPTREANTMKSAGAGQIVKNPNAEDGNYGSNAKLARSISHDIALPTREIPLTRAHSPDYDSKTRDIRPEHQGDVTLSISRSPETLSSFQNGSIEGR